MSRRSPFRGFRGGALRGGGVRKTRGVWPWTLSVALRAPSRVTLGPPSRGCRQGEASPSLSVQVGGGRGCFPECFPEEGVAREPVPNFEDVPVGEFYQDAVPFQI